VGSQRHLVSFTVGWFGTGLIRVWFCGGVQWFVLGLWLVCVAVRRFILFV